MSIINVHDQGLISDQATRIKWSPLTSSKIFNEVDLIVPFHGQYDFVGRLIESLWKSTRGIFYNVCLVDDGSPNKEFMKQIERMKVPSMFFGRHNEQKGFGASLNTGLKMTKSEWVVFLNSDVIFEDGNWLRSLGETYHAHKSKGVKMVSARMNNPPPGDPRIKGKKLELNNDFILEPENINQITQEDMFLPFVCTLAHRSLFDKLGPIKEYPLGWYEDLEFACRMHICGMKQAICGKAWVSHIGGATVNAVCENDKKTRKVFESNFDRCCLDIASLEKNRNKGHT